MSGRTLLVTALLLLPACTGGGKDGPPTGTAEKPALEVVVFEDLSPDGSLFRVPPAANAIELALAQAFDAGEIPVQVEVMPMDDGGEPQGAADDAREAAADPQVVAAVVAPFFGEQHVIGPILNQAGIPTISLSSLEPDLAGNGWANWRRAVATQVEEVSALAAFLREHGGSVCVGGDGGSVSRGLQEPLAAALGDQVVLNVEVDTGALEAGASELAADVQKAGCRTVAWTGFDLDAAALRLGLDAAGLSAVRLVGGQGMKGDLYLTETGLSGSGTVVSCPCVDVATSTELAARTFIHDYQFEFGSVPGPYAVEGWDIGRMLVEVLRNGATTREDVAAGLADLGTFQGLAGAYGFASDGELTPIPGAIHLYRDVAGRWIPMP